jgi:predicted oxidoreductase (fatty acid repression mutant protein)
MSQYLGEYIAAPRNDEELELTIAVWTALSSEGLGANLQHYSPLIDEQIQKTWNIPANWKLDAQLVFGTPTGAPHEKAFAPLEDRFKVFGKSA